MARCSIHDGIDVGIQVVGLAAETPLTEATGVLTRSSQPPTSGTPQLTGVELVPTLVSSSPSPLPDAAPVVEGDGAQQRECADDDRSPAERSHAELRRQDDEVDQRDAQNCRGHQRGRVLHSAGNGRPT